MHIYNYIILVFLFNKAADAKQLVQKLTLRLKIATITIYWHISECQTYVYAGMYIHGSSLYIYT